MCACLVGMRAILDTVTVVWERACVCVCVFFFFKYIINLAIYVQSCLSLCAPKYEFLTDNVRLCGVKRCVLYACLSSPILASCV